MQGKVRQLLSKEQRTLVRALNHYAKRAESQHDEEKREDLELLALEIEMAKFVEVNE